MNLNNLSMNYKIILGISTVTILTLIYQYIKNLFIFPRTHLRLHCGMQVVPWLDNEEVLIDIPSLSETPNQTCG